MKVSTFIERPVLSAVISITIMVAGIIGLFTLPVEQYPDIAPPTVMVSTTYFGANAETMQKSVVAPLEEAINGVEDMTYMTSTATNSGTATITIYFQQGTDPDMAAVNVQNRVSKATGQLPAEVTQVGVTTSKRQTSMLQIFSLYSPDGSYDENFLSNYISINLKPEILRISGVGELMVMGGDYSMRIWMKPDSQAFFLQTLGKDERFRVAFKLVAFGSTWIAKIFGYQILDGSTTYCFHFFFCHTLFLLSLFAILFFHDSRSPRSISSAGVFCIFF